MCMCARARACVCVCEVGTHMCIDAYTCVLTQARRDTGFLRAWVSGPFLACYVGAGPHDCVAIVPNCCAISTPVKEGLSKYFSVFQSLDRERGQGVRRQEKVKHDPH